MKTIQNKTTNKIVGIKMQGNYMLLYHCSLCLSLHIGESINFMNNDLITIRCRAVSGNNLQRWCSGAHYPDPVAHRHSVER